MIIKSSINYAQIAGVGSSAAGGAVLYSLESEQAEFCYKICRSPWLNAVALNCHPSAATLSYSQV